MSRRAAISKAELAKVATFLRDIGATVTRVEIEPGHATIHTTGEELTLTAGSVSDRDRAAERWENKDGKRTGSQTA